jgi:7,8-dihydropterin-6-yl-methyl-4-(beta-D-ribofuranosyl)aminobenzene 5'-phosphate synthase
MMGVHLKEVDKVEILTLQDNFIDIAAHDGTAIVQRAASEDASGNRVSILAEHGFSAVVSLTAGGQSRKALFDFGFSATGALQNARTLGVDLAGIDAMVLSHGHMDHHGGLSAFVESSAAKARAAAAPGRLPRPRYRLRGAQAAIAVPDRDRPEKAVHSCRALLVRRYFTLPGEVQNETNLRKER